MTTSYRSKTWCFLRRLVLTTLGLAVLGGAAATAFYLVSNPKRPELAPPVQEIPVVEIIHVAPSRGTTVVKAMGAVIPAKEVILQAEVSGRITSLHPEFMDGGIVAEGETLVEIDPRDYEYTLAASRAQIEKAQAGLKMEQGQQEVARQEWELLGMINQASDLDIELALRKPQLRELQASLAAAETQAAQARLNLERTKIKAPFNAIIRKADVRAGTLAGAQTQLASLVCTDAYWVQVSLAIDELQWIDFPHAEGQPGSTARVRAQDGSVRGGHVLKLLSDLEEKGSLARILIEVRDPLDIAAAPSKKTPLLLGERVFVEIEGCDAEDVIILPRTALRDGSNVWMMDKEGRLAISKPDLVWRGEDVLFCRGLQPGAPVIVSALAAPAKGMMLQVADQAGETAVSQTAADSATPEKEAL